MTFFVVFTFYQVVAALAVIGLIIIWIQSFKNPEPITRVQIRRVAPRNRTIMNH